MTRNIAGNRMNHFQSKWRQIIPFKELLSNCRPPFKKVRMSIYCEWPNFTEEICIHCDFCCIDLLYIDGQIKNILITYFRETLLIITTNSWIDIEFVLRNANCSIQKRFTWNVLINMKQCNTFNACSIWYSLMNTTAATFLNWYKMHSLKSQL